MHHLEVAHLESKVLSKLIKIVPWTCQVFELSRCSRCPVAGPSPSCFWLIQAMCPGCLAVEPLSRQVLDGFHISSPNLEHCHPNWTVEDPGLKAERIQAPAQTFRDATLAEVWNFWASS